MNEQKAEPSEVEKKNFASGVHHLNQSHGSRPCPDTANRDRRKAWGIGRLEPGL